MVRRHAKLLRDRQRLFDKAHNKALDMHRKAAVILTEAFDMLVVAPFSLRSLIQRTNDDGISRKLSRQSAKELQAMCLGAGLRILKQAAEVKGVRIVECGEQTVRDANVRTWPPQQELS